MGSFTLSLSTVQQGSSGAALTCSPPPHPAHHIQRRTLRPGTTLWTPPAGRQQQTGYEGLCSVEYLLHLI